MSFEDILNIDTMMTSKDEESNKLALSMALEEYPERILNFHSSLLNDNFKRECLTVREFIQLGLKSEIDLQKCCWGIHIILKAFILAHNKDILNI